MEPRSLDSPVPEEAQPAEEDSNIRDEERAFVHDRTSSGSSRVSRADEGTEPTRAGSIHSSTAYIRRQTSRLLEAIKPSTGARDGPVPPKLAGLIEAFKNSNIHAALNAEIIEVASAPAAQGNGNNPAELPDVAAESSISRGRKRASWATQFRILSGRAFKNLYRDPALLAAHYASAIGVARESSLFWELVGGAERLALQ